MSYVVEGTAITMTRGDTVKIHINIYKNGKLYVPTQNEEVKFSLKRDLMKSNSSEYVDPEPLLTKIIPGDTLLLHIEPQDTKTLQFGKYVYDIQLTDEGGNVDTFITCASFKITPEVD